MSLLSKCLLKCARFVQLLPVGLEGQLSGSEYTLLVWRAWAQCPASLKGRLTTACNSAPGDLMPSSYPRHSHICCACTHKLKQLISNHRDVWTQQLRYYKVKKILSQMFLPWLCVVGIVTLEILGEESQLLTFLTWFLVQKVQKMNDCACTLTHAHMHILDLEQFNFWYISGSTSMVIK